MNGGSERQKISALVIGARGYSGLETCRLLLAHPHFSLKAAVATEENWKLSDYLSEASGRAGIERVPSFSLKNPEFWQKILPGTQLVFLATPAEVSLELAPKILQAGASVVDLSGAFRLDAADYPSWYNFDHREPAFLERAHFGLVPFATPPKHTTADPVLVSNPGCYATSVLLALIPLLKAKLIRPDTLVVDAKSGTSGAGRKAAESLLFTEVEGECLPYRIGRHQHFPEILRYLKKFAQAPQDLKFPFTPHLLATRRGIIASIYAKVEKGVTLPQIAQSFDQAFAAYPLVRHQAGESPWLQLKRVVGTPRAHISYLLDGDQLYVFSLLDNLLKGAASQALENANLLFGFAPEVGLLHREGLL